MKSCLCLEILRTLRKIREITMKINVHIERNNIFIQKFFNTVYF